MSEGQLPRPHDVPHGDPQPEPPPAPAQEAVTCSTSLPQPEVAVSSQDHTHHPVHSSRTREEEEEEEKGAPSMPQVSGPPSLQALSSTDLISLPQAVTCQPQGLSSTRGPPGHIPLLHNGTSSSPNLAGTRRSGNGAFEGSRTPRKPQTPTSLLAHGGRKRKASTKPATSQVPIEAQEDCCVHCVLTCLFCEFLALCNILLDCATCGSCSSEDSCICCCCCCCGSGECVDCDLPCDMDCGIVDACCESADCLEICMECCGLCFSS
ncbi:myoD family inhibitor isoform X1 [Tachyglossus aculeatus]|uniref:myoD family inhibitor isoform X1 n=1 Tax=Tachyglossus aculeatus TaxID=9261 RepID=UPI0018F66892|nr:myoD family inhibitor isoform X1 [Tachyglossus aculeatus]